MTGTVSISTNYRLLISFALASFSPSLSLHPASFVSVDSFISPAKSPSSTPSAPPPAEVPLTPSKRLRRDDVKFQVPSKRSRRIGGRSHDPVTALASATSATAPRTAPFRERAIRDFVHDDLSVYDRTGQISTCHQHCFARGKGTCSRYPFCGHPIPPRGA